MNVSEPEPGASVGETDAQDERSRAGVVAGPPQRWTILVVDDEPDMLENVARILQRGPYVCLTASSARDALALLDRERLDLILTDLRMPGIDGLRLIRAARRLRPATPIVMVTAYAADRAAQAGLLAGATALLTKPFTAAQLLETTRKILQDPDGSKDRA